MAQKTLSQLCLHCQIARHMQAAKGNYLMLPEVVQGHKQIGGALYSLDIATGEAELLLDNWNGLRFNSPNDLVVRSAPSASSALGSYVRDALSLDRQ